MGDKSGVNDQIISLPKGDELKGLGEKFQPDLHTGTDALAAYGKQATDAITEIINSPEIDKQVKTHALVIMETINRRLNNITNSLQINTSV